MARRGGEAKGAFLTTSGGNSLESDLCSPVLNLTFPFFYVSDFKRIQRAWKLFLVALRLLIIKH